ncbi:MAG: G-D-S-L family lipolytic protein [Flaviramulus sp.]|nr:G-D-S-L family lipolytic protein [Flaviramulus sp.]NNC49007.1 G-D-S-L family lipolytic protein [Flaviramulus sp.]
MKNIKYLSILFGFIAFIACNEPEDVLIGTNIEPEAVVELPALTAGSANFATFVSLGNSLTAGFSDGTLFKASQEKSFPSILAQQFSLLGGGSFSQPLMNDNFGGLALGGNRLPGFNPRLVTTGGAPLGLESVIGPVTVTTDIALNNPTGPFNNMGVPGARSFHLLAPGYGNIGNLSAGLANPYFVRMTGTTPNASIIELSMAQSPTFFTLWAGNNDVLGYATSGGDGTSPITDKPTFDFAISTLITTLTSSGAKGVVANIPYVTDIPHFTTVPHNPVPLDAGTAAFLNSASAYGAYNAGIQSLVGVPPVNLTQEEADSRMINFTAGEGNAVVIMDESLSNMTIYSPALLSMRQATANDLLVLTASSFIGTEAVPGNSATVNGVAIPLADKWVLTPEEQLEIKTAVDEFNATIEAAANSAGLAFVDANALLSQLATTGIASDNFILTSNLVTGGAFSLDGVHLTSRGYAMAANEFMKAIDATYGSNFEASGNLVDIGTYPTNYSPLLP